MKKYITKGRTFLKLENTQPSGSFKHRGMSHIVLKNVKNGAKGFISSSGGNAGHAVAMSCQVMKVPCTIVVPESTPVFMREMIGKTGSQILVHGASWFDADKLARQKAQELGLTYVHPFDDKDVWDGNGTMIDEIKRQLNGQKPKVIVLSVGGGGLLIGVYHALQRIGWGDVKVVAVETKGAHSFYQSVKEDKLVDILEISSIAKTLGARIVAEEAFNIGRNNKNVIPYLVEDKDTVISVQKFLDEHRFLVEPSCGASLSIAYEHSDVISNLGLTEEDIVVFIVCGGSIINTSQLDIFKKQFNL
eukprot:TRINITY_DN7714_c0_g1_i1.p1 TRINITY_DN7714_c0_g1~~TRINITY_DN7714_c0_g1_i1.p1  ORF type:complete len:324 (+),score=93.59 TRINITY_DN7714_c0_g1_i1:61-972(+)